MKTTRPLPEFETLGISTREKVAEREDDAVYHPSHYTQGKVECIDALEAATCNLQGIEAVCTANAIKYLWRWKRKGGVESLEKAEWYIKHLKEYLRAQEYVEPDNNKMEEPNE